jgi:hypothetical protein
MYDGKHTGMLGDIGVQVKTVYHMDITVATLVSKYDYMGTTPAQSIVKIQYSKILNYTSCSSEFPML